ncbi:hypothetical protein HDU98_008792 [Podochytrium sp. JEL0797]|nr:hypothetical protein HDU98_008792 [Podochytrium sp. JEL0797]
MDPPSLAELNELLASIAEATSAAAQNQSALRRLVSRSTALVDAIAAHCQAAAPQTAPPPIPPALALLATTLIEFLKETDAFVRKTSQENVTTVFMHNFVNRDLITARIQELSFEQAMLVTDFSLALQIESTGFAEEDALDRKLDAEELDRTLQHLVDNDYKILNALELKQVEYLEAIDALQKHITDHVDEALERNIERLFLDKALASLRRATNSNKRPTHGESSPEWVLTSWEFEMGPLISRGGFGEVLKAKWLGHTVVAVKRLHIRLETAKLKEDFYREVRTWFPLRHPNILPLLGACATAERPFMVSPFMERGHALQYLEFCDEEYGIVEPHGIKLLYEVSMGMQYLHARGVSHGDLKAVNILVR